MSRGSIRLPWVLVTIAGAMAAARADDAADAERRFRDAFRPLRLAAASKIEKDTVPLLPGGIVTESGPFDAVIRQLLAPHEAQLRQREELAGRLASLADPAAALASAISAVEAEQTDLATRVAAVEAVYADVWAAAYMESGEKEHRARKLSAVLIPFYRTLAARNAAVAARAPAALASVREPAQIARVASLATADPSASVRAAASDALGRIGGPEALAALLKVRAADAVGGVRTRALAALCGFRTADVKDAVIAALSDPAWEARALAAEICVRAKLVEAAGAIVAALEREDGRLRTDFDLALHRLVGVRFYGDAALAKKWWTENRDSVADRARALAAAGEYDKAVGLPESWDGPAGAAEPAAGGRAPSGGVTSSFYGIETSSRRVLFVVDISLSMADPSGAKPAAVTRSPKDPCPGPAGGAKIDVARWQLHRAVAALPKDASFGIVVFSESYKPWQDQMAAATDRTRAKAHEFIDSIRPNGTTNICDSIDEAFDLALASSMAVRPKTGKDVPGPDTVFLMTDGNPNRGRTCDPAALLDSVVTRNRAARLVIHTIGIGEAAGSALLRDLALRTGGQYVEFR